MRNKVTLDTEVQILQGQRLRGHDSASAPEVQKHTERVTIKDLLSQDFSVKRQGKDDFYVLGSIHEMKSFRHLKDDTMYYAKEDYTCPIVALDLDWHRDDGRDNWYDAEESLKAIKELHKGSRLIRDNSVLTTSSRGGIRVIFILDETLNAPEWQSFYDKLEEELLTEFESQRISNKVAKLQVGEFELHLDRRNPYSLTRVPYGFRDGIQVADSRYISSVYSDNVLSHTRYGEPSSVQHDPFIVKGYKKTTISYYARPMPTRQPKLPAGMSQFSWGEDIPEDGTKEFRIWQAVSQAKTRFKDSMTPEQYYTYFFNAMTKLDAGHGGVAPIEVCWTKILSNWLERLPSESEHDELQMRNSGGNPLFLPDEFNDVLDVKDVYDYTKNASDQYIEELIDVKESSTTFFNPPAGAGKSTAALSILKRRGGIYIAPSNKQIVDFLRKYDGNINQVLSYKALISVVTECKETIAVLVELHDNIYVPLRKEAAIQVKMYNNGNFRAVRVPLVEVRGKQWAVSPFPKFLKDHADGLYRVEAKSIDEENKRRMSALESGETSIMTHSKLINMCAREGVRFLPANHLIIFDEAKCHDVVDPELYLQSETAEVYGSLQPSPYIHEFDMQSEFHDLLRKHTTIFINADRGLDIALTHNGFKDVKVVGRDMKNIYDKDLHIVLSPSMKAGFTPHRNKKDKTEYSPRAVYAKSVNESIYTLITNGKSSDGVALAKGNNLTTMVGSNDYLNSRVISMLTSPSPVEVSVYMYSTGVDVHEARKMLFQNQINQVIARNVGYRAQVVVSRHAEVMGLPAEEPDNMHILVLPSTVTYDSMHLAVKTSNVWSVNSPHAPAYIEHYLRPMKSTTSLIGELYKMESGSYLKITELAKRIRLDDGETRRLFDKITESDMLADYSHVKTKTTNGVKVYNQVFRCHTLKVVLGHVIVDLEGASITLKELSKRLLSATSERYMKSMSVKATKIFIETNAFRYDYRVVGRTLERCDEHSLFK